MEAKIESIKIKVGKKVFELTEEEAVAFKGQLDKLFGMASSPIIPIITEPFRYPTYPVTYGDHTEDVIQSGVFTTCGDGETMNGAMDLSSRQN